MQRRIDKWKKSVYTEITKSKEVIYMKKLIALLLAVLMMFSVVTVAFAEGEPDDTTTTAAAEEENSNAALESIIKLLIGDGSIENMPIGTAKAGLKIAKIFLKLAKAFIKVGDALGFIDGDKIFLDLVNSVAGQFNTGDEEAPAPENTTAADPAA